MTFQSKFEAFHLKKMRLEMSYAKMASILEKWVKNDHKEIWFVKRCHFRNTCGTFATLCGWYCSLWWRHGFAFTITGGFSLQWVSNAELWCFLLAWKSCSAKRRVVVDLRRYGDHVTALCCANFHAIRITICVLWSAHALCELFVESW